MSEVKNVITIDGPAASGKSSVSRELASRLSWNWVSTGAFYRGLAFVAMQENCSPDDVEGLVKLANSPRWQVLMQAQDTRVQFDGEDVTDQIKLEKTGSVASQISHHPEVREVLLAGQRACARVGKGLVAEGRDCGSVIFPEAPLKVYLTAHQKSRAARRAKEQGGEVAQIERAQQQRDALDAGRKAAPLQVPENAHVVDTSEMGFAEVVDHVYALAQKVLA